MLLSALSAIDDHIQGKEVKKVPEQLILYIQRMMKRAILLPALLALIGAAAFVAAGRRAPEPPSPQPRPPRRCTRSWSSCSPARAAPPARRPTRRSSGFAQDPNVVAISRPVTYWDSLGWRDTLARPANTALQRAYAARQHSDDVYTPQAVVQGAVALVGGRTGAIHRAIDEAAARPGPGLRFEMARAAACSPWTAPREGRRKSICSPCAPGCRSRSGGARIKATSSIM